MVAVWEVMVGGEEALCKRVLLDSLEAERSQRVPVVVDNPYTATAEQPEQAHTWKQHWMLHIGLVQRVWYESMEFDHKPWPNPTARK